MPKYISVLCLCSLLTLIVNGGYMGYQDHDAVTKIAFDDGYKHGYADAVDGRKADAKPGAVSQDAGQDSRQTQSPAGDSRAMGTRITDLPWSTSGPWGSQTKLNYKVLGVKAMEPYTAADADSTAKCIDDCVTSHTPTGFAPDVRSAKLDKEMDARFAPEPSGKAHDLYGNLCNEAPRYPVDDRQYKAKSAVVTDQFGTPTKYTAPVRPYEPKFDSFVNTFGTPAGSTGSPEYTGEPGGVVLTPSGIGEQVIDLDRRVASLDQWSHNALNLITQTDARLDRLVDHVNREIGVAQDVPLHARLENPEWFTGVDQFIGRVDKELEEHRRELRRIVHGPSPAPLTEKEVARLIVTFAAGMSSFGVVIDLVATAENINNYITGKR